MDEKKEKSCGFCFNVNSGFHYSGCPVLVSENGAETEWLEGWKVGFQGIVLEAELLQNMSPSWLVGYRVGHIELDKFMEAPLKTGFIN
jgi:hypothetical protein